MMDESKTPPTHLGSCRYLTLCRGGFGFVRHSIAILFLTKLFAVAEYSIGSESISLLLCFEPNPFLTIRNFSHRSTPLLTALKRMLLSRTARQHDACMLLNRLMANGPAASCFPRLVEAEVCEHLFEVLREAAGVCAHTTHRTWPWGWFLSSTARGSRGEGNR
jgi:hypothetical protein